MSSNYDSSNIVVLEGLDAVRLRPGMYIGTTGPKGLHHLLWEIVDNSIDEVSNGFGDTIWISLHTDGSCTVSDNGRGIPVDIHKTLKKPAVEVVFTQLHAGGKFNSNSYSYSGGLHGVGASVANALSTFLNVDVHKDGVQYAMEFESKVVAGKMKSGIVKKELYIKGKTDKKGTTVTFLPDCNVFGDATFSFDIIDKRVRELAFLNSGIKLELVDERTNTKRKYQFTGGIVDYISFIDDGKSKLFNAPVYFAGESNILKLEVALEFTDSYTENIFSYVNNIPTSEGGTHEAGFKSAFTKVFNDYAKTTGFLKEKDGTFQGEDFREGLSCIINVKMRDVEFEGQTKTKLGNMEAKTEVERITIFELSKMLLNKDYEKIAKTVLEKAKNAKKTREAAKKAKEITRAKNNAENFNLVGKLSACTNRKGDKCELFIVEGDSAGGSAKQGRDRQFQAILPLRGKPLNAEKKRIDQVLANEEIRTIISALETGIGEDYNEKNLRYNKVIILADADQDGAHIRAILLTFFFRYMRRLVAEGHVFVGLPPLYKVFKKGVEKYAYSDEELESTIKEVGKGYQIQRYKGLGEMNPEQLWETTMDPKQRTLVQVTIDDAASADKMVTTWMGDNIDARKAYIAEHADFSRQDAFAKKIL